jgi:O-antigen ligase
MLIKRRFVLLRALQENTWLVVLFAFMFVSILWSAVPFTSLKRWIHEIVAVIMGFVVLTEKNPRQAVECVVRRTIYILIPLSLLLIKYFPQYGLDYISWSGTPMWIGVADQKNGLGQLTSFATIFLIWSLQKRFRLPDSQKIRYLTLAELIIWIIALYLSKGSAAGYSATAFVTLAVALIFFSGLLWLKKKGKILGQNAIMAFFTILIIFGASAPLIGRLPAGDITSSLGRDSTLTGRTENWATLLPVALTKPVLGHGLGGFWTSENLGKFYFPAHNGYLEVLLILGFVGLLLFSMFLISSARKAQNQLTREYEWGVLWICWLTMALLYNITESSLHSFSSLSMAVPLWLALSYQSRELKL